MRAIRPAVPFVAGPDGARRVGLSDADIRCDACHKVHPETAMEKHDNFYLILCVDWKACNARWRSANAR